MDNTIVFSVYQQGASHKPDKPCQDRADHLQSEVMDIIVLSDGHGGKKYFRSHFGAEIATEIAMNTLSVFCKEANFALLLDNEDLIQIPIEEEADEKYSKVEYVMRHVFQHICSEWHRRIEDHFKNNPLTEEELDFLSKETDKGKSLYDYYFDSSGNYNKNSLPSAYGCTLFGVAEINSGYWLGFQIGDGKCIAFREDGTWYEPIPWDKRCFQNLTTSLSHYDDESFRYCIGHNIPPAIFIASDGMDDSYAPMSELAFEYVLNFMANLAINGKDYTESNIKEWLDRISENYSRDDMSVGYIVDDEKLKKVILNFITLEEQNLIDKKDILERDAYEKKEIYEKKLHESEIIDHKIGELSKAINDLMEQGENKQLIYDKNQKEIDSIKESSHNFLNKIKASVRARKRVNKNLSEKEDSNRKLDQEIYNIRTEIEGMDIDLSLSEHSKIDLQKNLPILKKHATEANRIVDDVHRKLKRIERVRQLLQTNYKKE